MAVGGAILYWGWDAGRFGDQTLARKDGQEVSGREGPESVLLLLLSTSADHWHTTGTGKRARRGECVGRCRIWWDSWWFGEDHRSALFLDVFLMGETGHRVRQSGVRAMRLVEGTVHTYIYLRRTVSHLYIQIDCYDFDLSISDTSEQYSSIPFEYNDYYSIAHHQSRGTTIPICHCYQVILLVHVN